MNSFPAQPQPNLPLGLSVLAWLAVFLSPSAYFFFLAFWTKVRGPTPPVGFVISLFCLIPIVALLVCGSLVWRNKLAVSWRIGGLVLTVLGMALQVGVLLVIIRVILVATISYAQ